MSETSSGISRLRKVLYASGNIGYNAWFYLLSSFLLFFLIDVVFLDAWLAAIVFGFSFGFLNALTDPIVGNLSDRTRSRFGRRRPWIVIGAPLCLLLSLFIYWVPPLGGEPLLNPRDPWIFAYMLLIIGAAELAWTMCAIPYHSLFPEMFTNIKERIQVSIYRQVMGPIGAILAMAVFPVLVTLFSGTAPLEITTTQLPDGMQGKTYNIELRVEGGAPPYTWDITGDLPEGLSLSTSGVVSGIPSNTDSHRFTVRARDSASREVSRELDLSIRAPGEYGITIWGLPDGRAEDYYEQNLHAIMEEAPYTWSLESGVMPDGLTLSPEGVLSGFMLSEGNYLFTVRVTDAAGNTDIKELDIRTGSSLPVKGTMGGWAWAGGLVIALGMASYLAVGLWGTRERREFRVVDRPLGFIESLKKAVRNRALVTYSGAHVMTWSMTAWLAAMLPFYAVHVLGQPISAVAPAMGSNLAGIMVSFVLWRRLCMRYGARSIIMASVTCFVLALLLSLIVGNVLQLAIMGFLAGVGVCGTLIARDLMFADIIDDDELRTGVRREGVLMGFIRMVEKLSLVITAFGTGFLLSTIIGYVPGQAKPAFMEMGIRLGFPGFAAVLMIVALFCLKFYPLTKERVDENAVKLARMHADKAEQMKKLTEGSPEDSR